MLKSGNKPDPELLRNADLHVLLNLDSYTPTTVLQVCRERSKLEAPAAASLLQAIERRLIAILPSLSDKQVVTAILSLARCPNFTFDQEAFLPALQTWLLRQIEQGRPFASVLSIFDGKLDASTDEMNCELFAKLFPGFLTNPPTYRESLEAALHPRITQGSGSTQLDMTSLLAILHLLGNDSPNRRQHLQYLTTRALEVLDNRLYEHLYGILSVLRQSPSVLVDQRLLALLQKILHASRLQVSERLLCAFLDVCRANFRLPQRQVQSSSASSSSSAASDSSAEEKVEDSTSSASSVFPSPSLMRKLEKKLSTLSFSQLSTLTSALEFVSHTGAKSSQIQQSLLNQAVRFVDELTPSDITRYLSVCGGIAATRGHESALRSFFASTESLVVEKIKEMNMRDVAVYLSALSRARDVPVKKHILQTLQQRAAKLMNQPNRQPSLEAFRYWHKLFCLLPEAVDRVNPTNVVPADFLRLLDNEAKKAIAAGVSTTSLLVVLKESYNLTYSNCYSAELSAAIEEQLLRDIDSIAPKDIALALLSLSRCGKVWPTDLKRKVRFEQHLRDVAKKNEEAALALFFLHQSKYDLS